MAPVGDSFYFVVGIFNCGSDFKHSAGSTIIPNPEIKANCW